MQTHKFSNIAKATQSDSERLTTISFTAKEYWNYPQHYIDVWSDELTITSLYVETNIVYKYTLNGSIVAYYSLVNIDEDLEYKNDVLPKGLYLDHMYIMPEAIRKGIGTIMFQHLIEYCKSLHISEFGILSDPNSKDFYMKLRCEFIKEFPSNIPNRTTPYLRYTIEE
ncbi:MAG: GNAT family N-acetyltransferase [Reichenbachiella sp.]